MNKSNGADNSVLKMSAGNLLETIDRCAERSAAYHRWHWLVMAGIRSWCIVVVVILVVNIAKKR